MCIIIIKNNKKRIDENTLQLSAKVNPDGLGILWLDSWKIEKCESKDWKKLNTKRPYIAHFRYATVGAVTPENVHPFESGHNQYLFQNGTVQALGNRQEADTYQLAQILKGMRPDAWKEKRLMLEQYNCRFVIADLQERKYHIYNQAQWHEVDGILYSKANVINQHTIAVYGTLKYGYSNYNRYLTQAHYLGEGVTADPMRLIQNGLPYMLPYNGQGKNVNVDLFSVTADQLNLIDQLEGHPNWYERKQIDIMNEDGQIVKAWAYINDTEDTGIHLEEYTQQPTYNSYASYYNSGQNFYDEWEEVESTIQEEQDDNCECVQPRYMVDDYSRERYCMNCGGIEPDKVLLYEG